jgi:hypothetical protein
MFRKHELIQNLLYILINGLNEFVMFVIFTIHYKYLQTKMYPMLTDFFLK